MEITTTRFGKVKVSDDSIYNFDSGILGFPKENQFAIISEDDGPLKWMQSLNSPELAFVICDPLLFKEDYQAKVHKVDLEGVGIEKLDEAVVMVILVLREDPNDITANLLGPIVFNTKSLSAKQLVLQGAEYSTKHKVLGSAIQASAS